MNLEELYTEVGGSYDSVKEALASDRIIAKYVRKFTAVTSFAELQAAIDEWEPEAAFRAVHALKGICQNIGFLRLQQSASELTELLRPGNELHPTPLQAQRLLLQVAADYCTTLAAVQKYLASQEK